MRLEENRVTLEVTPAALEKLGTLGYDPDMGARPLRRVIQQKVEDPLSDALLAGDFVDGDTVLVDLDGDEVVLRKKEQDEETTPPEVVAAA